MPMRRTFYVSDEASFALDNYVNDHFKGNKKHGAYSKVVSDAIMAYIQQEAIAPVKDVVRNQVVPMVRAELERIASLIVKVGIDVDMLLLDMLDVRSQEDPSVPLDVVYDQLREAAIQEFRKQRGKDIVDKYTP